MGLMCLKSALLAVMLPETQGQATLETIGDVNSPQIEKNPHYVQDDKSETKF